MGKGGRSALVVALAFGAFLGAAWRVSRPGSVGGSEPAADATPDARRPADRYWKGNLHTHSLWSDGDDFPEMIADWYKRHGYHFLAMSDHNVQAQGQRWIDAEKKGNLQIPKAVRKYRDRFGDRWVERRVRDKRPEVRLKPLAEYRTLLEEPGRFLLIPSEEITHRFSRLPVHINATNLRDVIQPIDGSSVTETIRVNVRAVYEQRRRLGRPMVPHLNHPNFVWGVRAEDMAPVEELRFFEVYNGHPSVGNYGDETHASCERIWDIVLALRLGKLRLPVVYGVATDDAHRYHEYGVGKVNPGRGWMMVKAPYLSPEAIVHGMEAGDFYCSTGVALNRIRRENDTITIDIAAEEGIRYVTRFIATNRDAPLDSEPVLDADGKRLPVTGRYDPRVGKVVAETESTTPSYRLTGNELYVRAKIVSDKPHPNPYQAGDTEVAWTQPVTP